MVILPWKWYNMCIIKELAMKRKGRGFMNKFEDMLAETKMYEMLRKRDDDKIKKVILWILAIVGAVAAVAAIAYAVYRFFTPDYLEDFEEDFEDDFEDDFDDEFFEDDEL